MAEPPNKIESEDIKLYTKTRQNPINVDLGVPKKVSVLKWEQWAKALLLRQFQLRQKLNEQARRCAPQSILKKNENLLLGSGAALVGSIKNTRYQREKAPQEVLLLHCDRIQAEWSIQKNEYGSDASDRKMRKWR